MPGPWWSHITHYPLKLANIRGQRVHHIHALHQKYGPVVRIAPGEVAVADAAAAKTIHRPASGYEKAAWYRQFVQGNAEGMFDMTDPKKHAARRRLFARAFGKSEIRGRWEGMVRGEWCFFLCVLFFALSFFGGLLVGMEVWWLDGYFFFLSVEEDAS